MVTNGEREKGRGQINQEFGINRYTLLLLLLLSRFSRVRLCVTPQTAAHQAPLSLGFSRQEHCSGLPCPSPMYESENESEVAQSCLTLRDSMDRSLPGSSVHGIFQARVLEWGAIAFSQKYTTIYEIGRQQGPIKQVNNKRTILNALQQIIMEKNLKMYIYIYIYSEGDTYSVVSDSL